MNGGDHVIKLRQNFIRQIERAIAQNVTFNSRKDAKTIQLRVELSNRSDLEAQFCLVDAMCLDRAAAVVGDAQIFQSERLRSFRHLFNGIVSVARSGVTMKCPAQVFLLDQLWERMFSGGFKFAPMFP